MEKLQDELSKINIHWWDETIEDIKICFEYNNVRYSIIDMEFAPIYEYYFYNDTDGQLIGKFHSVNKLISYIKESIMVA